MQNTRSLLRPSRRGLLGFTLIELMIAVAIVGILVRIAYPAYMQSVMKSRRTEAKNALLDLASREERYFSINNQYTNSAPSLGYASTATVTAASPMPILSGSTAYYQMAVTFTAASTSGTTVTPWSFTATATPIGNQASDACGTYTLTSTGAQSVSGTAANCW